MNTRNNININNGTQSNLPSYEEIITKSSNLPSYDEATGNNKCIRKFMLDVLFFI